MQRESPTDATVTTHPSIITKVTVVPDVFAVKVKIYCYTNHISDLGREVSVTVHILFMCNNTH